MNTRSTDLDTDLLFFLVSAVGVALTLIGVAELSAQNCTSHTPFALTPGRRATVPLIDM